MPNRLAPRSQNALLTSVPTPYSASTLAPAPTRFNAMREAENLSIGLGRGFTAGLEGTKQLLTQPVATARALVDAARQVGADPSIILEMLRAARQKAMSGSLGLGELIGENVTPGVGGRKPVMAKMATQESELTRRAKQFQEIKDAAMARIYPQFDDITGDVKYPENRSLVFPSRDAYGFYGGGDLWELERNVGEGKIRVSAKYYKPVANERFGSISVDLEALGDVPEKTGLATEMYLEALAIAQEKNAGFKSSGQYTRSSNADAIYKRLQKKGVPFELKKGQWVLSAKKLAQLDLAAIAAKPYK